MGFLHPVQNDDRNDFDNMEKDMEFAYQIGLSPEFSLASIDSTPFKKANVVVDDATLDKEIDYLQTRYSAVADVETSDAQSIVSGKLTIDGDQKIDVNTHISIERAKEEKRSLFIGLSAEDSIEFDLQECFTTDELSKLLYLTKGEPAPVGKAKLEVSKVSKMNKAELGLELYGKILGAEAGIETEEDFRGAIRGQLQTQIDTQVVELLEYEIFNHVVANTAITLPEDHLRVDITDELTKEKKEVNEDIISNEFKAIKQDMILEEILANNDIRVEQADLEAAVIDMIRNSGYGQFLETMDDDQTSQFAKNYLKQDGNKNFNQYYTRAKRAKAIKVLKDKATVVEEPMSYEDFLKRQSLN